MSKVTLPNYYVVQFYYYYSSIILLLCWLLAPFLFYVIITKSSKLNSIKWLILNHSFWCLALETLLGLVKPLFMSPAAGGIQIGIFKDFGNFRNTAIAALICLSMVTNCIHSLLTTISTRYMFVFDSKLTILMSTKGNLAFLLGTTAVIYAFLIITFLPMLSAEEAEISQWAFDYDPILSIFSQDPSFFLIPHSILDRVAIPHCILIIAIILALTIFSAFFIFSIFKNQTKTTTKLQTSLIISCIMQIHLTNIFLLLPVLMFFVFIIFDIPNSATFMCIFMCILSSHCLLEFLATLYFISPYRCFVLKLFKKYYKSGLLPKNKIETIQVSVRSVK